MPAPVPAASSNASTNGAVACAKVASYSAAASCQPACSKARTASGSKFMLLALVPASADDSSALGRRRAMEIAIVGGGITGLGLALNLQQRGFQCRVYEAVPEIKELGVGITLLPHAMRELARLGLQEILEPLGIENRESCFFNRFSMPSGSRISCR